MRNQLDELLGHEKVQELVDLFPYLSMRIHVKAQYFFEAKSQEDLLRALRASSRLQLPLIMLGGGSNMVFHKSIIEGLVVKNSFSDIKIGAETTEEVDVEVGSGTSMAQLVQYLSKKGYSGLEYHKGLPGTVGGAVYMNSKWTHPLSYVGDSVLSSILADARGVEKKVDKEYFAFGYDYSSLQKTREFVISVTFRFKKMDPQTVAQRAQEALEYRSKTQPHGKPTCGCFFRNISEKEQQEHKLPTKSAGYLIEQVGMKGKSIGSFAVSDVHANFIINRGGNSLPEDLKQLTRLIKDKVYAQFGIELIEEVEIK
jgi:UDP-N-acetylmuramate dehydrogenase